MKTKSFLIAALMVIGVAVASAQSVAVERKSSTVFKIMYQEETAGKVKMSSSFQLLPIVRLQRQHRLPSMLQLKMILFSWSILFCFFLFEYTANIRWPVTRGC